MVDSSIRYIHRSSYTPPLEPECIPLESCPIVHTLPRASHTLELKMHAHPLPQAAHPACAPIHARAVRHLRKQPHSPKQYTPIHSRALSTSRWTRVISAHSPPHVLPAIGSTQARRGPLEHTPPHAALQIQERTSHVHRRQPNRGTILEEAPAPSIQPTSPKCKRCEPW